MANNNVKDYSNELPSTEVLYQKALKGELVNNNHVKVNLKTSKDKKEKVVKIQRLLNERTLSTGEEIKTIDNTVITAYAVERPVEQIFKDDSYTWKVTAGFLTESKSFNGSLVAYKATDLYMKAETLDSRFRNYSLYEILTAQGDGFLADGTPWTIGTRTRELGTYSYPPNGKEYSTYTGWNFYVIPMDGSGMGINLTYKYQRIDTGTVYTFKGVVPLTP